MGQFGSFIQQNPEALKAGTQLLNTQGAGGKAPADAGKLPESEKTGFQSMAQGMDQFGQSFDNLADSQFAATEEYRRQRAQGMPEPMKPQLQDVESAADSKTLSDFQKGEQLGSSLKGIFGDNKPAMESDMDVQMPDTDVDSVEDEDNKLAKMNALKGLIV